MIATTATVSFLEHDAELAYRWPAEKAHRWMEENGWPVGCNYIPGNAINQLEMWQADTFSPDLIDKELSWAASLGFNTVRVFLHNLVWNQDGEGYLQRIDEFLSIAYSHGIRTMFVLFDAVWDPFPQAGIQAIPKQSVHNSGWVQCPGYHTLNNPDAYDELHGYVHGIVSHFRNDERVLIWDLYNEPDNTNLASYKDDNYQLNKAELSLALLKKTINWVRVINPVQPITMAPWQNEWCANQITAIDEFMFSHSDIISFHCYEPREGVERRIKLIQRYNRPMLCTEYMARPLGNTFEDILPLFRDYNIGAYNWGLVQGKTQTHCAWDSWGASYASEPPVWFHDIFKPCGEPYRPEEVDFLRSFVQQAERKVA